MARRKKPKIVLDKPKLQEPLSESTLPQGTGKPYLAIFDMKGNPILDLDKGLPIGLFVTGFTYEDDETKDDCGEIEIQTDNVNLVGQEQLKYLMPIQIQWGWEGPSGRLQSSPVRSVVIKEHDVDFTPEGVKFTLKISSSTFLLKAKAPVYNTGPNGDTLRYIINLAENGGFPLLITDYSIKHSVPININDE